MKIANTPNTMTIAGQPAIISFIPELNAFRGKFIGLSGYCDFVADSISGLQTEGELSLREYLEDCAQTVAAAEHQVSVNSFIVETLNERMKHA